MRVSPPFIALASRHPPGFSLLSSDILAPQPGVRTQTGNSVRPRKLSAESTFPPPADGPCFIFLCKLLCGET